MGRGFWFQVSIQSRMSASSAWMLVWTARWMSLSVISPKKHSTWLTQEAPVRVKWTWNLQCLVSQVLISSVVWVA